MVDMYKVAARSARAVHPVALTRPATGRASPTRRPAVRGGGSGSAHHLGARQRARRSDPVPVGRGAAADHRASGSPSIRDADGYVERLSAAGVVGLGFGIGLSHEQVPAELLDAAERAGLALLEVPRQTPFIAIGRAVSRALAADEYAAVTRTFTAQQELTKAALSPAGPGPADPAAGPAGRRLGGAGRPGGRRDRGASRGGPRAAAGDRRRGGPAARAPRVGGVRVRRSTGTPSACSRSERRAAPRVPRRRQAGPAVRRRPAPGQRRGAAAHAGLRAGDGPAGAARGAAHRGPRTGAGGLHRGSTAGPGDRRAAGCAAAARSDGGAGRPAGRRGAARPHPRDRRDRRPRRHFRRRAGRCRGGAGAARQRRRAGRRAGREPGGTALAVGLSGETHASTSSRPATGRRAGRRTPRAGRGPPCCRSRRSAQRGVTGLLAPGQAAAFAESLLAPLVEHDRTGRGDLVASLRAWLAHHGQWDPSAAALGVHRHTLRNRIRTVERLLGRDLDSPTVRSELWLALEMPRG